ncbi:site-specific integrase [Nonomuraea dietziae]|uniref:site-specific integrase n=1 Tax=Nonomuraea dietziae TaxID=65515 RepID=UPI003413232D
MVRSFGLELDQIDLDRREVDISQQLVCVNGRKPYLGPPKTRTSARTIELPDLVCKALREHLKHFAIVEQEIDDETDPRKPLRRTAKLLFTTNLLLPMHQATWSHIWSPAARTAGIPPRIGLHCLRHYFATLLIHKGASVMTVQLALGHSTPMVTLNTYIGE